MQAGKSVGGPSILESAPLVYPALDAAAAAASADVDAKETRDAESKQQAQHPQFTSYRA